MSAQICRVTVQLIDPHQKRRGDHPRQPRCDGDILRSLAYWRQVRRASPHCDQQYRMHRGEAMRPVALPHGKAKSGLHPVFSQLFQQLRLAA
jgi:hypothetical protein